LPANIPKLLFLPVAIGHRYTSKCILTGGACAIVAVVSDEVGSERKYATVVWEGNAREILRSFPEATRQNLGFDLWRLQQGERLSDYRPLPSIGAGVFELRDQDERAWYRVIYLSRRNDVIYVLHCFEKKGRELPRREFGVAKHRFKAVLSRLSRGEMT